MKNIRILADDLTGALDTAAAFDGEVPVYIDCPPVGATETNGNPVSVVATPTRDVTVSTLGSYLAPVVEWFAAGDLPFKKVDSLLRGNTFAEIAWLLLNASFTRGIFAPAFPAQRRITVADRQWTLDRDGTKSAVAVQGLRGTPPVTRRPSTDIIGTQAMIASSIADAVTGRCGSG